MDLTWKIHTFKQQKPHNLVSEATHEKTNS
jgi:hypothetical protein